MTDPVLAEIRDLLKEQNRLIAELKEQNELALRRQADYVAKAQTLGEKSLSLVGNTRWLSTGVWVFMGLLLLLFAIPLFINWR